MSSLTFFVYVKDTDGNPVSGAIAASVSQPKGQLALNELTNASGYATFRGLAAGDYSLRVSKRGFETSIVQLTVNKNFTLSSVTVKADLEAPVVSVSVDMSSSDAPQVAVFTVMATDGSDGSGISLVTLFVDGAAVKTWVTEGVYNYTSAFQSQSTHAYYVEAFDNADNKARAPASGNYELQGLSHAMPFQEMPFWQIAASIALLVCAFAVVAVVAFRRSRHENYGKIVSI